MRTREASSVDKLMSGLVRNNMGLKITSVIAAVVIWMAVRAQTDPVIEQRSQAEVAAMSVASDMQVLNVEPSRVYVTLRGRRSMFHRMGTDDIRLVVNLSESQVGTHSLPVKVQYLRPGLQLVSIERQRVQVELDKIVTASRPVLAQSRGRCAEGFAAKGWQVQPNEVQISGAASDVQRVDRLVAVVDLAGASATIKRQIVPQPRDEANMMVENISIEPSKVTVTIPVERVETRTVPIRPNIGTVPRGWELVEVRRDPSTVTLAGEGDALARITAIDTARVDISDLRGSNAYSVPLEVPSGVTVLGPSSARVTVTLRRIESRSSSAEQAPEQGAPGGGVSERQPGEADGDKPPADQEEAGGLQKSDGGKNPRRSTEPSGTADADRADTRRTPADAN